MDTVDQYADLIPPDGHFLFGVRGAVVLDGEGDKLWRLAYSDDASVIDLHGLAALIAHNLAETISEVD